MKLAGPAEAVAGRLRSWPGIQRVPSPRLDLFILRDFLEPGECDAFCELIDSNRRPSTIADDVGIANFRTSETCDLDPGLPLVAGLQKRLSELTGIPLDRAEPLQGQRYAVGQEFRAHTDSFNPGSADYYIHTASGGQRTWTAMLYLNQPEEGGATRFRLIGKTVQPERGKLLLWNNLLGDGAPNPATLHHGMKVRRGTKFIITQWYRELPFH
ncbi:MAG: 2OG-Fe(II) oxygenase [Sphingomonas sp.]|nr:2OG-Fe(II) oxygenase [Sphingomonas sp.]